MTARSRGCSCDKRLQKLIKPWPVIPAKAETCSLIWKLIDVRDEMPHQNDPAFINVRIRLRTMMILGCNRKKSILTNKKVFNAHTL